MDDYASSLTGGDLAGDSRLAPGRVVRVAHEIRRRSSEQKVLLKRRVGWSL